MASPVGPERRRRSTRQRARHLRAAPLLLLLSEVVVVIIVGQWIGPGRTFLALLACSAVGAALLVTKGGAALSALRAALVSGQMPAARLVDAVLTVAGGVLLLVPGFVTAALGVFFAVPFTRSLTRRWLARVVQRRVAARTGIVPGTVVTRDPTEPPTPGRLGR